MADPVDFKGSNIVFHGPPGRDDVRSVNAFRNRGCVVTRWKLTESELADVNRTGCVWLSVLYGGKLVPVYVGDEQAVRDLVADYGGTFERSE